ncbi:hypothetical protein [Vibrio harveyi]|uniref:hypothetical protein n=1 Tax=Vibrio harveyi TaxID=669 RepID=UPI0006822513|nr:hypothetical protein [Vibrio harveyi]PNM43653.1 hypothetical protein AL469_027780 [Vibrio harveyi]
MNYDEFIEVYEQCETFKNPKDQLNEAVIGGGFGSSPKKIASGEASGSVMHPGPESSEYRYEDEDTFKIDSDIIKAHKGGSITPFEKYLQMRAEQVERDARRAVQARPEERTITIDLDDVDDIMSKITRRIKGTK